MGLIPALAACSPLVSVTSDISLCIRPQDSLVADCGRYSTMICIRGLRNSYKVGCLDLSIFYLC